MKVAEKELVGVDRRQSCAAGKGIGGLPNIIERSHEARADAGGSADWISLNDACDFMCAPNEIGPRHAGKITPENVWEVIRKGVDGLRKRFRGYYAAGVHHSQTLSEHFRCICGQESTAHKMNCALHSSESMGDFKRHIDRFAAEQGIDARNADYMYVAGFLDRQIRMKELLAGLYGVYIPLVFGQIKGEREFSKQSLTKFRGMVQPLEESISEFECVNAERLRGCRDLVGFRYDDVERIGDLRAMLRSNGEISKEVFYDRVCQHYAGLVDVDFLMHEDDLMDAVKRLEDL